MYSPFVATDGDAETETKIMLQSIATEYARAALTFHADSDALWDALLSACGGNSAHADALAEAAMVTLGAA